MLVAVDSTSAGPPFELQLQIPADAPDGDLWIQVASVVADGGWSSARFHLRVEAGSAGPGDEALDVVKAFSLSQNRPNPFNPTTVIEFTIPEPCQARLEIYAASGERVRTLLQRPYTRPTQDRVAWDGRDDGGRVVASGLYFYRLVAGHRVATRRMLLLK
jgi:hypothetical protein